MPVGIVLLVVRSKPGACGSGTVLLPLEEWFVGDSCIRQVGNSSTCSTKGENQVRSEAHGGLKLEGGRK